MGAIQSGYVVQIVATNTIILSWCATVVLQHVWRNIKICAALGHRAMGMMQSGFWTDHIALNVIYYSAMLTIVKQPVLQPLLRTRKNFTTSCAYYDDVTITCLQMSLYPLFIELSNLRITESSNYSAIK